MLLMLLMLLLIVPILLRPVTAAAAELILDNGYAIPVIGGGEDVPDQRRLARAEES